MIFIVLFGVAWLLVGRLLGLLVVCAWGKWGRK